MPNNKDEDEEKTKKTSKKSEETDSDAIAASIDRIFKLLADIFKMIRESNRSEPKLVIQQVQQKFEQNKEQFNSVLETLKTPDNQKKLTPTQQELNTVATNFASTMLKNLPEGEMMSRLDSIAHDVRKINERRLADKKGAHPLSYAVDDKTGFSPAALGGGEKSTPNRGETFPSLKAPSIPAITSPTPKAPTPASTEPQPGKTLKPQ
jgi:hypothetical protein